LDRKIKDRNISSNLPDLYFPASFPMPVHCAIVFPRLTEAELRELDYEVMGHAVAAA